MSPPPCPLSPLVALVHFCDNHGPSALLCTRRAVRRVDIPTQVHQQQQQQRCEACHSLSERHRSIVTPVSEAEDERDGVFFSANLDQEDEELCLVLKRAAVRSLSFESSSYHSPRGEAAEAEAAAAAEGGSLIFKLSEISPLTSSLYVLSSVFRIRDAENVRGFRRTYGILVIVPYRNLLLRLSNQLLDRMQRAIANVQVSSLERFGEDPPTPPPAAAAITRNGAAASASRLLLQAQGGGSGGLTYRQPRNLSDVASGDVYVLLHRHFVGLLRLVYGGGGTGVLSDSDHSPTDSPPYVGVLSEDVSALASLGGQRLYLALTALACGAGAAVRGEDAERVAGVSLALSRISSENDASEENAMKVVAKKNNFYECDVRPIYSKNGVLRSRAVVIDIDRRDEPKTVDIAPVVADLAQAIEEVNEGEKTGLLAERLLESRRHDYLQTGGLVRTLLEGDVGKSSAMTKKSFASLDTQRLVDFAKRLL